MENPNVVSAFTEDQTSKLTGISKRKLRNWDRTDFFTPEFAYEDRSKAFSRLYSFGDLVSLKTLFKLNVENKVSLQHLRHVKAYLETLDETYWQNQTLYVLNKKVVFEDPKSKKRHEPVSGQRVFEIPMRIIVGSLNAEVAKLKQRDPDKVGKIETARMVQFSKPTIAGTRVPVSTIRDFHSAGYSVEQIKLEFPALTESDIRAAIDFKEAV